MDSKYLEAYRLNAFAQAISQVKKLFLGLYFFIKMKQKSAV